SGPETTLEIIGTASGRILHAQDQLRSSGALLTESGAYIAGTSLVIQKGNGRVGIGTASPSALLEVSAATTDATLLQEVARLSTAGRTVGSALANRGTLLSFYDGDNPTLTAAVGGIRQNAGVDYNSGLAF